MLDKTPSGRIGFKVFYAEENNGIQSNDAPAGEICPALIYFLHDEHFHLLTAGHKFEAALVKQRLFNAFFIGMYRNSIVPSEEKIAFVHKTSLVNNWQRENHFEKILQIRNRSVIRVKGSWL
jgi:hypothetical protein